METELGVCLELAIIEDQLMRCESGNYTLRELLRCWKTRCQKTLDEIRSKEATR